MSAMEWIGYAWVAICVVVIIYALIKFVIKLIRNDNP